MKAAASKMLRAEVVVTLSLLLLTINARTLSSSNVFAQRSGTITEWSIPTPLSAPIALTLDQSGSCCWFLENYANKVGHFNPSNGTFQEWTIPTTNSNPYGLALASGSPMLWGTEFGSDKVFAFLPTLGIFREYSLPHFLSGAAYISVEPGGSPVRVWFTEVISNRNGELIYDPSTASATLYEDTFPADAGGGAYGVYAEANDVWFAGFSALIRWDRTSGQYTMWQLPSHGSALGRFVTVDPYGQVWYTQGSINGTSNDNFIGVLRGDSTLQEWRLPSPGADPRGLFINPSTQQPWIAERSLAAGNGAVAVLSNSSAGKFYDPVETTAPSAPTPLVLSPASNVRRPSTTVVEPTQMFISYAATQQFATFSMGSSSPQEVVVDSKGDIWASEPATNKIARISELTPDFALNIHPQIVSIPQGGAGSVSMTATSISNYEGTIAISAVNLPYGVTYSLNPQQLTIRTAGNASSMLTFQISSSARPGTTEITIRGNDGDIAHSVSTLLTVTNSTNGPPSAKSQCLIATATYGSELSLELKQLRTFRDNLITTKTGASFLIVFNAWYYSFSPSVADYLSEHSNARWLARIALYPLIGSLTFASEVYSKLSAYPEFAAIISGLLASSTIGVLYLGLPLSIIRRKFKLTTTESLRMYSAQLICGLFGLLLGLNLANTPMLMVAEGLTVLSTIFGTATLFAEILARLASAISLLLPETYSTLRKTYDLGWVTPSDLPPKSETHVEFSPGT